MKQQVQVYQRQPVVTIEDSQAYTTSLHVARYFGKEHYNVVRDIETILKNLTKLGVPGEFSTLNFECRDYVDSRGKIQRMHRLSEVAFYLTAMGFTGPEALRFKIAYVAEFERMKAQLKRLTDEKLIALQAKVVEVQDDALLIQRAYIERIHRNPAKPVTQYEHDKIIELKRQDKTTAQIKEKTAWSKSTITTHVRQARERGELPASYGDERLKYPGLAMAWARTKDKEVR